MKKSSRSSAQRARRKVPSRPTASHEADIAKGLERLEKLRAESPKAAVAIELLNAWLTDESGYDEETWPKLKAALERERRRVGAGDLVSE